MSWQQQPQWGQPQWDTGAATATNPTPAPQPTPVQQPAPQPQPAQSQPAAKEPAPMPTLDRSLPASDDVPADVILQVANVKVSEIHDGVPKLVMPSAELVLLSLRPTPAEIAQANANLNLPPGTLQIRGDKPLVFAIAGNYKLPVCETVPTVREEAAQYIFAIPNLYVMVEFPESTEEDEIDAFEMVVRNYGILHDKKRDGELPPPGTAQARAAPMMSGAELATQAPREEPQLSAKIAGGIAVGSMVAVKGIKMAGNLLKGAIHGGSQKIVENTDACQEPVQVPTEAKQHLKSARQVTQGAVMVSSGMAASLLGVTTVVGQGIAGQIAKRHPKTSDPKYDGVKEVAGAAIGGVGMIFVAATDTARELLTAGSDGVSTVVTHKFGAEAGQATTEGLGVVQDVVAVQQNMKKVGAKAIIKATGKQAAQHYMDELEAGEQAGSQAPAANATPQLQ